MPAYIWTSRIAAALAMAFACLPALGVESGTIFQTALPTEAQVPNWTTGWPQNGTTGWDYVGEMDSGPSGVYLGYGWVLTAGHVGLNNFYLGGVHYLAVPNSGVGITANGEPVDLYLFRIQSPPNLPPLMIRDADPLTFARYSVGSQVVMIGFGGGKSWGYDTINYTNDSISLSANQNYVSNDFVTLLGSFANSTTAITNSAFLVVGDSGGGDFIYNTNSGTGHWELAGINEAIGPAGGPTAYSLMVQLDTYKAQINAIVVPPTDSPTMPDLGLAVMACLLGFVAIGGMVRPSRAGIQE